MSNIGHPKPESTREKKRKTRTRDTNSHQLFSRCCYVLRERDGAMYIIMIKGREVDWAPGGLHTSRAWVDRTSLTLVQELWRPDSACIKMASATMVSELQSTGTWPASTCDSTSYCVFFFRGLIGRSMGRQGPGSDRRVRDWRRAQGKRINPAHLQGPLGGLSYYPQSADTPRM